MHDQQLRRIPQKGETIVTDGARITVLEVTPQRVERVRVERVEPEGGRPASGGLP